MLSAIVGLRMAIKYIIKDKECAGRNLEKMIDDLAAKGHVNDGQKLLLHRIRKRGNAGGHDARGMTAVELIAGISNIDGLLESFYSGP